MPSKRRETTPPSFALHPDDILGVIFQHSAPSWEGSTPEDSLSPRGAPWLLSHVCRRWRNMVLSESPNLWTFLVLKLDDHSRHITPTQCVFKTYLCLERSRNRPLSVRLYSSASTFKDHPVLPLLQASAARWKTLKAVVPASSLEYFSGTPFPILRDFKLS
ncbi:hypothetical protein BDZ89DRAFT_304344 [Hymenopellis radicata]|nr:hypothetical protein BDZ89DRAFT_304344 [Hymenopellis radicata]